MKLIAITGGIGSGKSVIARIVQVMGYHVYDCDSRARMLMTESEEVRQKLIEKFGQETYLPDGSLNRQHLSAIAFADPQALSRLNDIVHPATAADMMRWGEKRAASGDKAAFVETALLRTAHLDSVVDDVWHVTAPSEVRIKRVQSRSGLSPQQVMERMEAQRDEERINPGEQVIINDNNTALLPQVMRLLSSIQN